MVMTFAASGAWEFSRSGGSASSVGATGQFHANGTYMGEWSHSISALQTERGSKQIAVTAVYFGWSTSAAYYYNIRANNGSMSSAGTSGGTYVGQAKGKQQYSHWISVESADSTLLSNLSTWINAGATTLYFSCANDRSVSGKGLCCCGELTLYYEYTGSDTIIHGCTSNKNTMVPSDTVKLTTTVCNTQSSAITSVKVTLYDSTHTTAASAASAHTVTMAAGATQSFTDTFTLLNQSGYTERASPLSVKVELLPQDSSQTTNVEYLDNVVTVLNKRYAPSIDLFNVGRCDSEGVISDTGTHLLLDLRISLDNTTMNTFTLTLYEDEGDISARSTAHTITVSDATLATLKAGLTDDMTLLSGIEVSSASDRSLMIVLRDSYESASSVVTISKAFANVHLSGATTGGVCFGGISTSEEGNPKFECNYPATFDKGITNLAYSATDVFAPYRWIDGRQVHRRVFTFDRSTSDITDIGPFTGYLTVLKMEGAVRINDCVWAPLCVAALGNEMWTQFNESTGYIEVRKSGYTSIGPGRIILEYTNSVLPEGYVRVEYIGSRSTDVGINTGVVPNADMEIEVEYMLLGLSTLNQYLFGSGTTKRFNLRAATKNDSIPTMVADGSGGGITDICALPAATLSTRNTVTVTSDTSDDVITITDGTDSDSGTWYPDTRMPTGNLILFRTGTAVSANGLSNGNIYRVKIKKAGSLVRDMYPCYRVSDSEIGMYDVVGSTFYPNCVSGGTGEFVCGEIVDE